MNNFTISKFKGNSVKLLYKIFVLVFWILVWQFIYMFVKQEILIPSPVTVLKKLYEFIWESEFWLDTLGSMFRITIGYLLALIIGTFLSIFSSTFYVVKTLVNPLIHIIKATPVVSFIIIAIVWIKSNGVPIFISFLIVIPIVWGNLTEGISKVDKDLIDMAKIFYPGKLNLLRKVYLPSIMPFFVSACTTSIGLAWKAGIAAEVIAHTKYSIGAEMYNARIYIETIDLFAWTIVVIIMSILIENLMLFVIKRFKYYKRIESS